VGRIVEHIKVQNYVDVANASEEIIPKSEIRTVEVDAIIDTGATFVCLSRKDIETLGLNFHKSVSIGTANGKTSRRIFSRG